MSGTSTSPIIMGILFVLRCLIPLGILFGVSYLLRRLELVIDHAEEAETEKEKIEETAKVESTGEALQPPVAVVESSKKPSSTKPTANKKQAGGKKKSAAPKKKKES